MDDCALLVIDMQVGAFDGKEIPAVYQSRELLDAVSKLIGAARASDTPVMFAQHCANEGQLLVDGTEAWKIHTAVAPASKETVIRKRESSTFDGTGLEELLEERGIEALVVCGIQSEHCVYNTCISALELGLNVHVAKDAHSTCSTEFEEASAIIGQQNAMLVDQGAVVETTATLVDYFTAD